MWIKNTVGKPDAMLTFASIAFAVVTFNVLLATINAFSIGEWDISFAAMEAGTLTAYLGATFGAYVSRRWTTARYDAKPDAEEEFFGEDSNGQ
jgi:uncharacterized membrane protein YiaA